MKLLLFKVLLLYKTKEQGFTLPLVIGIGLIMVLLGSMSLVQSSEEQLNALYTTQASTSLAMAELGVARYRQLLDNNRVLAIQSLNNWTNVAVTNQTCDVISNASGDNGWANTTDWRVVRLDEDPSDPLTDYNSDGDTTDTQVEIGSYRIVNYVYQNDNDVTDDGDDKDTSEDGDPIDPGEDGIFDQTSDDANPNGPRGILKVQGQAPGNGGVTQIQVTIPIGVNTDDLETLDPGIWIYQADVTNLGIIDFTTPIDPDTGNPIPPKNLVLYKSDVVNSECATFDTTALTGATITHLDNTGIRDPRNLPPLATIPANSNNLTGDISADGDFVANELILGKPSANSNIDPDDVTRYYYLVAGDLDISPGESLLSDGKAKVVVIVNGNLNISGAAVSGTTSIANTSNNATSNHMEIHVAGDVNISGSGNININALINARNGKVGIIGSPQVNLRGSIWANDWSNAGTVRVIREDRDDESYRYYSIVTQRTPRPLTYPPTGWEEQEADL